MNSRTKNERESIRDQIETTYFKIGRDCMGPWSQIKKGRDIPENLAELTSNAVGCLKSRDEAVHLIQKNNQILPGNHLDTGLFQLGRMASKAGSCHYSDLHSKFGVFNMECKDTQKALIAARSFASKKLGLE